MMGKLSRQKKIIFLFIVLHLLYAFIWGWLKTDCYVDEYFTYGLANYEGSILMEVENGKAYTGTEVFDKYFTVAPERAFDFSNVWAQQAADVHPPFYYVIIHSICSFFPGIFSKWFGLIPNFICLIIIDLLVYKVGKTLLHSDRLALVLMVVNGINVMTMGMTIFIRMYALLTVVVLATVLWFACYMDKVRIGWGWIGLYLLSVIGTMVQYYFLILLFFLCLFRGIVFLHRKEWKNIALFCTTLLAAGLTCIMLFPPMLEQIFGSGYRGQEARENLRSVSSLPGSVIEYVGLTTKELFGGHVVGVLFFLLLGYWMFRQRRHMKQMLKAITLQEYMLLGMVIGYMAIIIKIAPYRVDRYFMCIGWGMVLLVIDLLYRLLCLTKNNWYHEKICMVCLIIFLGLNLSSMTFLGWKLPYAYTERIELLEKLEEYKKNSAVFVYDPESAYMLCSNYRNLPLFRDYTFVYLDEFPAVLDNKNDTQIVLQVCNKFDDTAAIVQEVLKSEQWKDSEFIGRYGYADVYCLSK